MTKNSFFIVLKIRNLHNKNTSTPLSVTNLILTSNLNNVSLSGVEDFFINN